MVRINIISISPIPSYLYFILYVGGGAGGDSIDLFYYVYGTLSAINNYYLITIKSVKTSSL